MPFRFNVEYTLPNAMDGRRYYEEVLEHDSASATAAFLLKHLHNPKETKPRVISVALAEGAAFRRRYRATVYINRKLQDLTVVAFNEQDAVEQVVGIACRDHSTGRVAPSIEIHCLVIVGPVVKE